MVDLQKRAADAEVSLVKQLVKAEEQGHDLGEVTAQVILVFDHSGSMERFFTQGEVQELAERTLGLALPLDDDGNIQVFPFDHRAYDPFVVDAQTYPGAIDDWRNQRGRFAPAPAGKRGLFRRTGAAEESGPRQMGGTDYSVVINKVLDFAREEGMLHPGKPPVFVLFQTDGSPNNPGEVQRLLAAASMLPVFWQFLGLGYNTSFLSVLDDLPGRVVDNVGLTSVPSIVATESGTFYDKVTEEFVTKWIPAARSAKILLDRP